MIDSSSSTSSSWEVVGVEMNEAASDDSADARAMTPASGEKEAGDGAVFSRVEVEAFSDSDDNDGHPLQHRLVLEQVHINDVLVLDNEASKITVINSIGIYSLSTGNLPDLYT
jgi:hypothetical protein